MQDYLDNSIRPLFERLSAPVTPHVRQIWAEEDSVVVRWDSDATALDGEPYRNSYAWFFTMRDGEVIEATAFLDLPAYDALIDRVKPRPPWAQPTREDRLPSAAGSPAAAGGPGRSGISELVEMAMSKVIRVGIVGASPGNGWAFLAYVPALKAVGALRLSWPANRGRSTV